LGLFAGVVMFIDIPCYPFDEEEETFKMDKPPVMVGFNTKYITNITVVKHPDYEAWVLTFKVLGDEEKSNLLFPNEEEPTRIKAAIEAAESSQYVKDFKEVL
jgi:hypothetical protein